MDVVWTNINVSAWTRPTMHCIALASNHKAFDKSKVSSLPKFHIAIQSGSFNNLSLVNLEIDFSFSSESSITTSNSRRIPVIIGATLGTFLVIGSLGLIIIGIACVVSCKRRKNLMDLANVSFARATSVVN